MYSYIIKYILLYILKFNYNKPSLNNELTISLYFFFHYLNLIDFNKFSFISVFNKL